MSNEQVTDTATTSHEFELVEIADDISEFESCHSSFRDLLLDQGEQLDWHTKLFAVKAATVAGLGGLIFGYDLGVVSGALPLLEKTMGLSKSELELVVSLMPVGGILGASVGGAICDKVGRKPTIMLTNIIFIAGSTILGFAPGLEVIFVGRVIIGVGIAISALADIAYANEVAPPAIRGAVVSCYELMVTLGILLSYFVGFLFRDKTGGWRFEFAGSVIFAIVQALAMLSMPESPRWLLKKGRRLEAQRAMSHMYQNPSVIESQLQAIENVQHSAQMQMGRAMDSLCEWRYQLVIIACCMFFQQFSGHSNILNYAVEVFSRGGMEEKRAQLALIMLGIVKVIFTSVSLVTVDCCGRKKMLVAGIFVMMVSLLVLAAAFVMPNYKHQSVVVFSTSCVIVAAYALSFGPVTWLLTSELFSTNIKGKAIGFALVINWAGNFLVASTFLTCMETFGEASTFALHGLSCLAALVFVCLFVPETKDKDPEEIACDINLYRTKSRMRSFAKDCNSFKPEGFDSREQNII